MTLNIFEVNAAGSILKTTDPMIHLRGGRGRSHRQLFDRHFQEVLEVRHHIFPFYLNISDRNKLLLARFGLLKLVFSTQLEFVL